METGKMCRYAVIDIEYGVLLACGEKKKDFSRDEIQYNLVKSHVKKITEWMG